MVTGCSIFRDSEHLSCRVCLCASVLWSSKMEFILSISYLFLIVVFFPCNHSTCPMAWPLTTAPRLVYIPHHSKAQFRWQGITQAPSGNQRPPGERDKWTLLQPDIMWNIERSFPPRHQDFSGREGRASCVSDLSINLSIRGKKGFGDLWSLLLKYAVLEIVTIAPPNAFPWGQTKSILSAGVNRGLNVSLSWQHGPHLEKSDLLRPGGISAL